MGMIKKLFVEPLLYFLSTPIKLRRGVLVYRGNVPRGMTRRKSGCTCPMTIFSTHENQGRIQEFAKGGRSPSSRPFLSSPLSQSFPFALLSLPLPLEVGLLKPAKGSGERCKLPQLGPGGAPAENEAGEL